GAAAQIALEAVADFRLGGAGIIGEELLGGHDHAGRAVSALESVLVPERFLYGIELAVVGQTFDGEHFAAIGLHGENSAALDGLSVEHDGAGAAYGRFAPDVRAGKADGFAEVMDEQQTRLDLMRV